MGDNAAGIISCMDFNPDRSNLMAAGSYSGEAALYDSSSQELLFLLQGQKGGLTEVCCTVIYFICLYIDLAVGCLPSFCISEEASTHCKNHLPKS